MYISPGFNVTVLSRSSISRVPLRTRKKSSVSSCLCQTNSPLAFTTMTSHSLYWAMVRGEKYSENVLSFSARLILDCTHLSMVGLDPTTQWPGLFRWLEFGVCGKVWVVGSSPTMESGGSLPLRLCHFADKPCEQVVAVLWSW